MDASLGRAERLNLEGIVAKRKADPYMPGVTWCKIKNRACTQMEGRSDLFHRVTTAT
jgi:ATP-dependent DNA ligase